MDYLGMLKESWAVTWHNKKLWILGFLGGSTAGVMSGSTGNNNASSSRDVPYSGNIEHEVQQAMNWMHQYHVLPSSVDTIPELVAMALLIVAVLLAIGLIFWFFGVAARGGLVHLSREALEGRDVRLRDGWRVGFRYWGRVFAVRFVLALPVIALGGVASGLSAVAVLPVLTTGGDPTTIPLLGLLAVAGILFIAAAIAGVAIHMLSEVAVRYAVLDDARITESISAAWSGLWGRRGVFTTWLMTLLVSWGVGIVALLGLVPFALMLVGAIIAQSLPLAGIAALLMISELFLVCSISGTLISTVWTSFHVRYLAGEPNA